MRLVTSVKILLVGLLFGSLPLYSITIVGPEEDLQAVLNSGEDLALKKGAVYEVTSTLRYTKEGQRIFTHGANYPSEYATLRIADRALMMMIDGSGVPGTILERVICDGNRYQMSVVPKPSIGGGGQPAMVHFGSKNGDNQVIRNCVFMATRTWSTLKMHEFASNMTVEDNIFLGAGVGPRGNGREFNEMPFGWADAISCASTDSVIRNNFIIDPTDVGIVLYGAPGTLVENNLVATVSRESLGGINLVDGFPFHAIKDKENYFSYHGAVIRENLIDAFGARIHMAIPVGAVVWVPHWAGRIYVGGEVLNNTISGGAGGYGIVAHGIEDWKILGNVSTAKYSGIAEHRDHKNLPDDPAAYLFDQATVLNCELQPEFEPVKHHIVHLLRTKGAPEDENGYQMHDYGDAEIRAVVYAAYLEMLGRDPHEVEYIKQADRLRSRHFNADGLRRSLMNSGEFRERFGNKFPGDLHPFRQQRWFDVCDALMRENGGMYSAIKLYKDALKKLRIEK
ncbi:MAG: hypothetical protein AAF065_11385 [Verrucomicrobiota bacterium]